MIDNKLLTDPELAARGGEIATAETAANYMNELSWLVEELQEEIITLDVSPSSIIHARLISDLTSAIVRRTLLLRQSVRETVIYHQNLCLAQNFHGGTKND